jgi:hypothetical protein
MQSRGAESLVCAQPFDEPLPAVEEGFFGFDFEGRDELDHHRDSSSARCLRDLENIGQWNGRLEGPSRNCDRDQIACSI